MIDFVNKPVTRLLLVGLPALALQTTFFAEVKIFGVVLQIMLALSIAAGLAGLALQALVLFLQGDQHVLHARQILLGGAQAKLGIPSGLHVEHPLTGEPVAVWITNYVVGEYGEGALMGVPAHDERDFDFARQYGLPVHPVIALDGAPYDPAAWSDRYGSQEGRLINSGAYDGLTVEQAALASSGLSEQVTKVNQAIAELELTSEGGMA